MSDSDLLTVGRAFAQFLNLGNIAEQEYNAAMNVDASIDALFKHLDKAELTADKVQDAVAKLNIDLVLTAHPTEVTRRTLIHKHKELADCLQAVHQASLSDVERKKLKRVLPILSRRRGTLKKFVPFARRLLMKRVGASRLLKTRYGKPYLTLCASLMAA